MKHPKRNATGILFLFFFFFFVQWAWYVLTPPPPLPLLSPLLLFLLPCPRAAFFFTSFVASNALFLSFFFFFCECHMKTLWTNGAQCGQGSLYVYQYKGEGLHEHCIRVYRACKCTAWLNAWQHVATYKSGSKQTWRRIFSVSNRSAKAQTDRTKLPQPRFHYAEQLQPGFLALISSGCAVFEVPVPHFLSSHIAVVQSSIAALTKRSRQSISFSWAVFFAWWIFLSLVIAGHSTGKNTKQWNEDKFIIYFDIEWFPWRFVDEYQRPSIDICTIGNNPELDTNLAHFPISVQLWGTKLLRVVRTFKPSWPGRKNFDKWTSSLPARGQHAFVRMERYLCLEPVFRLLCVSMHLAQSVMSALASPKGDRRCIGVYGWCFLLVRVFTRVETNCSNIREYSNIAEPNEYFPWFE